jgi:tetratricopeptide (TPR) repeat protein
MAAFGVPVSHEDDALRAARAALDIRAGIAALDEQLVREHGVGLEVRIAFETGEVVATPTDARQRLVTGEAVGVAAKLEQSAADGEIVVGELAARLIDHTAVLESLGELEIKGRREPVRAYRLVELAPVSPAFESRAEAPLQGRKKELAALRRSLKRAVDGGSVRLALMVGSPGVGKSRLAAELARRTRGVTTLWGRCLSYGEGITYWPLREAIREASAEEERDAVLAALEAETPPPAPEIALLFRRLCETLARERPLVLVFDDLHWAEPTFLELLELVAERGEGPILVVCLARDELLEERPDYLEGRDNVDRIVLDPLSREETDALLDGLGGTILESDQRRRIVDAAEGNPFFLEQLLALAVEGGLAERELPATVQALLAARLDRLGPGERAVLERGAVVGKDFSAEDVTALLDPEAAPTADAHLRTLSARGFVRPRGEEAFSFRHILVREAVYRAAPKRLRAELHERYADRLDQTSPDLPELDEFVGYHLEQAYRMWRELGESDRRTEQVAADAGHRLGAAGVRALKRGDMPATVSLLGRATTLLPTGASIRRELQCELGIGLRATGDASAAEAVLSEAIRAAKAGEDHRMELRARIENEYIRLPQSGSSADTLLDATTEGIPVFAVAGDHRSLGRAWLLTGFVQGGRRCHYRVAVQATERALLEYKASGWPVSTCVGELAYALYNGPTAVPRALDRCQQLLKREISDRAGRANVDVFVAGLQALIGDFEQARILLDASQKTFEDLVHRPSAANYHAAVLAEVELLAGDRAAAEHVLREVCAELESLGDFSHLASRASDLADILYLHGLYEEADGWLELAEQHSSSDDVDARMRWLPVRAKIAARRGHLEVAEALALDAVHLAETSDALNRQGKVQLDLGEVLTVAGRVDEARAAFDVAVKRFEEKGNTVSAAHARTLISDRALV